MIMINIHYSAYINVNGKLTKYYFFPLNQGVYKLCPDRTRAY